MPTGKHIIEFDSDQPLVDVADNALRGKTVGAVTGGTSQTDKTGFVEGDGHFNPIGGVVNDTPAADPTEDQAAVARITPKRALHVSPRNAAGTEIFTSADPGRVAGNVAHDAVDSGSPLKIGAFAAAGLPTAVADADRTNVIADLFGRLRVLPESEVADNDIDFGNPIKIGGRAISSLPPAKSVGDRTDLITDLQNRLWMLADGSVAHDAVDAHFPIKIGAKASSSLPANVADADRANIPADLTGRILVLARRSRGRYVGLYHIQTGVHTVQASADGATAGRWFLVTTSSAVRMRLRAVRFSCQLGSALVAPTSPRIQLERFTFTGTPSGATVTPAQRDSTDFAMTGSLRTASTGMTLSAGAVIHAFLPTASATAVGYSPASVAFWVPFEDEEVIIRANEGVILRQADAGTASDTRRYLTTLVVEEYNDT